MTSREEHRIRIYAVSVAVVWTVIIFGFIFMNIVQSRTETLARSTSDALTHIGKDMSFRQWIAKHGGVYVPATEETPPNINLTHVPERDINTPSGKHLTLMNPAYALRQMMHDYSQLNGIYGHIISLKPVGNMNRPDEWEKKVLTQFEGGVREVAEISTVNGRSYLRAVRPFITEKSCLKCHGQQGYKEGDVRGGISVSLPLEPYLMREREEIRLTLFTYGSTWAIVIISLFFVTRRIGRHVAERIRTEDESARYLDRTQRQQGAMYRIISDLSSCDDFRAGARVITERVAEAIDVERVSIWLLGDSRKELNCVDLFTKSENTHSSGHVLQASAYPSYFSAFEKGKVIDAHDARNDPRTAEFSEAYLVPLGIMSMLDAAIWVRGLIVGVICHEHTGNMRTWRPDEVAYVTSMATQVSALLLNAERVTADEALRRSERSLKDAQRIAHIGNWELDIVSNRFSWSDEVYHIFEADPAGFGASYEAFLDAIHPDDRELVNRSYNESVMTRSPYRIIHRLLMHDGRVKFVLEQCETEYDADNKPLRSIGTIQDITEQKKLEEQLRQSQKMEVVGQLAGGIAHDFNNILSAIIGYGSMTLMKMESRDTLRPNVEHILEAADRAAQLTRSLLAFSRKQELTMSSVDLNDVIRKVESLLKRIIGEDIKFGICLSEYPVFVMADSGQIEQVLMNLLTNARDAMQKGGTIGIRTERTLIDSDFASVHDCKRAGEYALLTVTDTGTGMSPEVMKRIFEPFFTTKETGKGTGLGLAIVYGIISQHEGCLAVSSEQGKGTVFRIYLPLIAGDTEEQRLPAEEYDHLSGTETILLAEDDAALRELTKCILEEFGYRVITAVDGVDAVNRFRENIDKADLLLFDIVMPNMSGKEAYEKIRSSCQNIKAIFVSGYTPDILRDKVSLGEEIAVISKPADPSTLLAAVRRVLDGSMASN